MSVNTFKELKSHIGHDVVVVGYGSPIQNVAIECNNCMEVLIDFDKEEENG